jgi:L-lactate permease
MVSRPAVLVFLLAILVVTSQFEWKQRLVNELESVSNSQKHISSREDLVKDKVSHLVYLDVLEARFLVLIVLKIVQIYLR